MRRLLRCILTPAFFVASLSYCVSLNFEFALSQNSINFNVEFARKGNEILAIEAWERHKGNMEDLFTNFPVDQRSVHISYTHEYAKEGTAETPDPRLGKPWEERTETLKGLPYTAQNNLQLDEDEDEDGRELEVGKTSSSPVKNPSKYHKTALLEAQEDVNFSLGGVEIIDVNSADLEPTKYMTFDPPLNIFLIVRLNEESSTFDKLKNEDGNCQNPTTGEAATIDVDNPACLVRGLTTGDQGSDLLDGTNAQMLTTKIDPEGPNYRTASVFLIRASDANLLAELLTQTVNGYDNEAQIIIPSNTTFKSVDATATVTWDFGNMTVGLAATAHQPIPTESNDRFENIVSFSPTTYFSGKLNAAVNLGKGTIVAFAGATQLTGNLTKNLYRNLDNKDEALNYLENDTFNTATDRDKEIKEFMILLGLGARSNNPENTLGFFGSIHGAMPIGDLKDETFLAGLRIMEITGSIGIQIKL